ncbi:MAG TPA: hypothetical protein VGD43_01580 [Micromonospora sp.]
MPRGVTHEQYLMAVSLAMARRHRAVWSPERRGLICRCGSALPCRIRQVLLAPQQGTPAERQMFRALADHIRNPDGFCARCRMVYGLVRYPCSPVRLAVQTFATELGDRILDGLA